jgi:hypothetical protein
LNALHDFGHEHGDDIRPRYAARPLHVACPVDRAARPPTWAPFPTSAVGALVPPPRRQFVDDRVAAGAAPWVALM